MWLRNYPTKRKLLKDIENLRAENRHLSIELRNARTDLALEKTASSGYRHENRELKRKPKPLKRLNPNPSVLNVWGLKMPTTTRLFDEKNILRTLAKCLSNIKVGKYFELH